VTGWAVVGIGTADRGDDGVGLLVAEGVRELAPPELAVVAVGNPLDLLDVFDGYPAVVVVDAVRTGAAPGAVSMTVVGEDPLPTGSTATGTHGMGVAEAVELARALDRLPPRLVLVGVEVAGVETGAELSGPVAAAVDAAVGVVLAVATGLPEGSS